MSYPHEGYIRRWLENWVRWSPGSFGKSTWGAAATSHVYDGAPIPIMGGEAKDTQDALQRLDRDERRLLVQFHLGRASVSALAKRRRISLDTIERRLREAHENFYRVRGELVEHARAASRANATTVGTSLHRRRTTSYENVGALLRRDQNKPTDDDSR
jgi:hypothetical protein